MTVRICSFDPTLAPAGCTALVVHLKTDEYHYWVVLREKDRERYDKEKESIAQCVLQNLTYHLGPVDHLVEAVDVATPATYIRYTNIFKGSYQGWAPTPSMIGKALPKTIKGLNNVYLAGQWTWAAGGIPGVIRQARHIVQILCKKDGKPFTVIN
jgi:phytoene dehydrogenase-like protein